MVQGIVQQQLVARDQRTGCHLEYQQTLGSFEIRVTEVVCLVDVVVGVGECELANGSSVLADGFGIFASSEGHISAS